MQPKILAFAGSTRKESLNKKLIKLAVNSAKGAEITLIDLADFPMPIYDGDFEERQGLPEQAKRLKAMMISSDGFLISAPEYNSSISGVLKNAMDWVSRPEKNDPHYLVAYKGKVAALMSASPSKLGGLRSLVAVRSILGNIGTVVLPEQFCLEEAHEAFDERGTLKSSENQKKVDELVVKFIELLAKVKKV